MSRADETDNKTILCVDDNPDSCDLLCAYLGRLNYQVDAVSTVKEAEEVLGRNCYCLIFLDLRLPDGSGIELCQQIRKFDTHTPILFYSAEARHAHIQAAVTAGAQGFLVKPVDLDTLLSLVKRLTN